MKIATETHPLKEDKSMTASAGTDHGVLFVDDEPDLRAMVETFLTRHGYRVWVAADGRDALKLLTEHPIGILLTDLNMPGMDGLALLRSAKSARPDCEVIIVTGFATVDTAIEALKLGGYDYLQKPIEFERLRVLIDRIIEKKDLEAENRRIRRRLKERFRLDQLVGHGHRMQAIFDIIDRIRLTDPTVLIQGESGTGKEMAARVIHGSSRRNGRPFVAVNCGAFVGGLLESELFGHVRGAFTGATRDNVGLFKAADGGTLFLDEVGDIEPSLQVKLLRVLQERRIRAVGATREVPVDVRIIAATNRETDELIQNGLMRKDLFYRLNVVNIRMPALREMTEDIPLLTDHFLKKFNSRGQRRVRAVAPAALERLMRCRWPGNVRQLENVIERAFAIGTSDTIRSIDLPDELRHHRSPEDPGAGRFNLRENEIRLIRRALEAVAGRRAEAAKLLGINTATVYRKIEKYGL
jgi:DNA-binding NtrC family response regulator